MALIECKRCGQMMSDKAPLCPNCGTPNDITLYSRRSRSDYKRILTIVASIMIFVTGYLIILATISRITANDKAKEETNYYVGLREPKTIEEAKQTINGTTWHYTENLKSSEIGCWIKVSFENGNCNTYYAMPSDGHWTKGTVGKYKIEEGRYSNTGNKYIGVSWEGEAKIDGCVAIPCEFMMTLDNYQLVVNSGLLNAMSKLNKLENGDYYSSSNVCLKGIMEFGDYSWN